MDVLSLKGKQISVAYLPTLCINESLVRFLVLVLALRIWFPVQTCHRRFSPGLPVFPPVSKAVFSDISVSGCFTVASLKFKTSVS